MELGLSTFVELTPDSTGKMITPHERMKNLMEEVELAEQVGLDVFAIGEHHRPDFVVSAPTVALGAAAVRTNRIKLSSAVTVLSSDDPVRVFQQFATVDLLSEGRAEIMAGRGSFIESFPLFGYDLKDYDTLFSEKLDLLIKINENEKVTWSGEHRASINNLGVYPRPYQKKLPIWVAIGGTPESVHRAATLGLHMALAIIGGAPNRFAPYVAYYRDVAKSAGHDADQLGVGIHSHCFIADESQQAADEFFPSYSYMMSRIGKERGWPPMSRAQYDDLRSPHGSLLVGSPQEIIDKILYEYELFKNTRFLAHMTVGSMPHKKVLRSIELYGTVVAPAIRKALGKS
ncbi:LLM class flavin-dependent oxidoreductase [Chryseosolibacter indicus]|uniref:LLM class flavin-dependent oxidoreductase n=1 Tax=Chryseosolibacter indicus TaxID=2782351 RepID=A0ABS5VS86_9BACT|nr:LLM class flavin-dependent oxidoreductase [Chryseosolibacter indicus]MBT1703700.1 LLM class flavin-dependent oxidoreductase [Chryseosolibacter indicus]